MPITITGPDSLLGIVPAVLGFVPHDSIVMLCLDENRRVGLTARVDAIPFDTIDHAVITPTRNALEANGQSLHEYVLVGYGETAHEMFSAEHEAFATDDRLLDMLCVHGDRWHCAEGCHEGQLTPNSPAMLEFTAASGRTVASSRAEVESRYYPHVDAGIKPLPAEPSSKRLMLAWEDLLTGHSTIEDLRAIATVPNEVHVRDALVMAYFGGMPKGDLDDECYTWADGLPPIPYHEIVDRMIEAARHTDIPVLWATLAQAHWIYGDGTSAREANDAALRADPDYRLAILLDRIMDFGIRITDEPAKPRWS